MIKLLIAALRFYQLNISPFFGKNCRFHPTCSEYSIDAFKKYGLLKGSFRSFIRVIKCNPFFSGGIDPA